MKLLTKEIERTMPPLYSTENKAMGLQVVHLKLFTPWDRWTWFVTEASWADDIYVMFNYCLSGLDPSYDEWGYTSLQELEALRGPFGLKVERDIHFQPTPILEALRAIRARIPDWMVADGSTQ